MKTIDSRLIGVAKANAYIGKIGKLDAFFRSRTDRGNCGCCGRPVSTEVYATPSYRDEACPNRRCQGAVIKQLQQKYAADVAKLESGDHKPVAKFEHMPYPVRRVGLSAGQYAAA